MAYCLSGKNQKKLFEYKYPDLHLTLITKCPKWLQDKHGQWIELNDLTKERSNIKKLKKVKK